MKVRFMSGLVALLVSVSVSMAQDVTAPNAAGTKALLFSFSGLSELKAGSYNGGIGAKYFLTAPIAIRAGLQFGMQSQVVKTTLASGGKDGSNSATIMGITLGAEYHLSFARVSPFVGGVINYVTGSTTQKSPINSANGPEVTIKNGTIPGYTAPGNAFGIAGLGGVEFFITKELSLSAEYQLGYSLPMGYTQTTTTVTGTGSTDVKVEYEGITRFGISNNGALTLSVYF